VETTLLRGPLRWVLRVSFCSCMPAPMCWVASASPSACGWWSILLVSSLVGIFTKTHAVALLHLANRHDHQEGNPIYTTPWDSIILPQQAFE
jgi:hypothetical protein